MHVEVYTPELSLREASRQLHCCPATLSKDIAIARILLPDFREEWQIDQGIDTYRYWVLAVLRREMRSRKWSRIPKGRSRLKAWLRQNRDQFTLEKFNQRRLNDS